MIDLSVEEWQLVNECVDALRKLHEVKAEVASNDPDRECDAQIDILAGGNAATLLIETSKDVFPRDARQLVWRIREAERRRPHPAKGQREVFFLIARSISSGAKEFLRNERVGYFDSGGSLFLSAGNIYVCIDKPSPKSMSRSIRSVFSGRRAHVLQAILLRRGESFGVTDIASQARVSAATALQVLTELEKFDWVVSRGKGPKKKRHLQEQGALLDAWVQQMALMPPLSMQRYFVPMVRSGELVGRLAEAFAESKVEYAITHEAAGQLYSPYLTTVTQVRCRLLSGSAANQALCELDARQVQHGANLAVIETSSPGELLFRQFVNGIWLASPVQVYLDLMRGEGRASDLADHLRKTVLDST